MGVPNTNAVFLRRERGEDELTATVATVIGISGVVVADIKLGRFG